MRPDVDEGVAVSETMVPANGVDLCVETFGERTDPPVLLIGGAASSMDWWEDEFCRRLAAGDRYVIRYDHRDTGRSTSFPAGARYSAADLAGDALGLLDALEIDRAHLVGLSMGGALAQRIAVEHPGHVLSLTLMSTTAGLGEPSATPDETDDEPETTDEAAATDESAGGAPDPDPYDRSDRKVAVDRLVADVRQLGGPFTADEPQLRRLAERVFDRTTDLATGQANHWQADPGPPIRDRLGTIAAPALVLHGTQDPVFPAAVAEELAAAIPGARLVLLEGVGHEYPPAALWSLVLDELLRHTAG
jgi:pimeloyl-ACP methyl ester carboxylesterase